MSNLHPLFTFSLCGASNRTLLTNNQKRIFLLLKKIGRLKVYNRGVYEHFAQTGSPASTARWASPRETATPEDEYIELLFTESFTERQKHNLTEGPAINRAAQQWSQRTNSGLQTISWEVNTSKPLRHTRPEDGNHFVFTADPRSEIKESNRGARADV